MTNINNAKDNTRKVLYRIVAEEKTPDGGSNWLEILPQPYEKHTISEHFFICYIGKKVHVYDKVNYERILGEYEISFASEVLDLKGNYHLYYISNGVKRTYDVPSELLKNNSSGVNLNSRWLILRENLDNGYFLDRKLLPEPYVSHNQKNNCMICRRNATIHIYNSSNYEKLFPNEIIVEAYIKDDILYVCINGNWKMFNTISMEQIEEAESLIKEPFLGKTAIL